MTRRLPIGELGSHGILNDPPPDVLALNAWNDGRNVRMKDGAVEKFLGDYLVTTPSIAPYHLLPTKRDLTTYYWLYAGLTKVYVWDGTTHFNLTRQTASVDVDYAADEDLQWTSGVLGGIPILNNGVDLPQMWLPVDTSQRLLALSDWPSTYRCGAMRPFKQFLVAVDIDKNGTRYPTMIKWSHPAAPGAVPASWDETDTSKDAGEYELKETDGACIDMEMLRDLNIIYKTDSVYLQQFIGGVFIFNFRRIAGVGGILARNCAVEIPGGRHAVFGIDDIFVHNGQTHESVVDERMRRFVYNRIDPDNFRRSFVAHNQNFSEVLFCFPEQGASLPSLALVWNYQRNTLGLRELSSVPHMAAGEVAEPNLDGVWDADENVWDSDEEVWDVESFGSSKTRVLIAVPGAPGLNLFDFTNQFNGSDPTAYVVREGIGFPLKENGPPDFSRRKYLTRLWLRIDGTVGGVVNVYAGYQETRADAVVWSAAKTFTIGTSRFVDFTVSGRMHAVKIESTTDVHWRLAGYDAEVRDIGRH